jgi:hypothetical protein
MLPIYSSPHALQHGSAHVGVLLVANLLFLFLVALKILRGERFRWRWRI